MTLYYKTKYKPFYEQWKSSKKPVSVLVSLRDFVDTEFDGLLKKMTNEAAFEFIELMKLLVFAHRHNKKDEFLKDRLIDFDIVREPMYKYSRAA